MARAPFNLLSVYLAGVFVTHVAAQTTTTPTPCPTAGQEHCGSECYDPNTQVCCPDAQLNLKVCNGSTCCYPTGKCCKQNQFCLADGSCRDFPPSPCKQSMGRECNFTKETCCGKKCCPHAGADVTCCKSVSGTTYDGACCKLPAICDPKGTGRCVLNPCDAIGLSCNFTTQGVCCGDPDATPKSTVNCCPAPQGVCCGTKSGACCLKGWKCFGSDSGGSGGCKKTNALGQYELAPYITADSSINKQNPFV